MRLRFLLAPAVAAGFALTPASEQADWPQWRGAGRDAASGTSVTIAAAAPEARWSVEVGLGHAGPIVVGEHAYQFARRGDREVLAALLLTDGTTVWESGYAAPFEMNAGASGHGPGPKSTPAYDSGRVFTLGIGGIVSAFDAAGGEVLWRHRFEGQFDQTWPMFGAAASPIVVDDRMIVHVGGITRGAVVAFAVEDGTPVWRSDMEGPAYASPILAIFDGVAQLVTQTSTRIVAVSPADGTVLWSMPFRTKFDQNIVTAVVDGGRLILSGLDQSVFAVEPQRTADGWSLREIWRNDEVPMYMSSPVRVGSRLFGMTHRRSGQFFALDTTDGRLIWRSRGREGENASLIVAGSEILALTDDARLLALAVDADDYNPRFVHQVADSATWAHPALVGDALLVKDLSHLTLLELQNP